MPTHFVDEARSTVTLHFGGMRIPSGKSATAGFVAASISVQLRVAHVLH